MAPPWSVARLPWNRHWSTSTLEKVAWSSAEQLPAAEKLSKPTLMAPPACRGRCRSGHARSERLSVHTQLRVSYKHSLPAQQGASGAARGLGMHRPKAWAPPQLHGIKMSIWPAAEC